MSIDSLKDVYVDQLQDLYSANGQSMKVTKELAKHASNPELKKALERGIEGIEDGIRQLTELTVKHNVRPDDEFCRGMEGLVKEARAHGIDESFGDDDARDAMIITQYQRMAHYAIAGYGCVVAFAKRLDLPEEASILQTCLDAVYNGDQTMTELATTGINKAAV